MSSVSILAVELIDKMLGMASISIHAENLKLALTPWGCQETLLTHKSV